MSLQESYAYISPEDYLEGEKHSPIKHEYVDGQVFAMSGTTLQHNIIALNVAALLKSALRGGPCRVFMVDIKARIEELNRFFYPDVMVECERDREPNEYFIRDPKVVIEVLSASTEEYDRGDKFFDYGKLESLEEYVLVHQKRRRVERYRRTGAGEWAITYYVDNQELHLESLDLSLPLDIIYEDVEFGGAETQEQSE